MWALDEPDEMEIEEAIDAGIIALGNRELFEENLQVMPINTPSYRHQRAVSTTAEARRISKRGYIENHATTRLAKRYAYAENFLFLFFPRISIRMDFCDFPRLSYNKRRGRHNIGLGPSTKLKEKHEKTMCNFESRYRDPTGRCNNKKNPFTYGVAYTAFRR